MRIPQNVNCKSRNVIYAQICTACPSENVYVGKTSQVFHNRNSGHRNNFNDRDKQKSACSFHGMIEHDPVIGFDKFESIIIKQSSNFKLDRAEFKCIEYLRTRNLGLNRIKTVKN